jgi:ribosomal protein L7Ae-like RNA K-turn-binding protein
MMGFAARAGKVIFGTEQICQQLKKKAERVKLVLVAQTASDGTKKKIRTKCEFYGVRAIALAVTPAELGKAVGKTGNLAALAVMDEGFADAMVAKLAPKQA